MSAAMCTHRFQFNTYTTPYDVTVSTFCSTIFCTKINWDRLRRFYSTDSVMAGNNSNSK